MPRKTKPKKKFQSAEENATNQRKDIRNKIQ